MSGTHDTGQAGIAGEGDDLDPRRAAEIIEQTAIRARRQFDPSSPMVAVLGAGVFLFGYGSVWWSMRDQHVYTGPAGWSVAVLYGLIAVSAIASRPVFRRATAGIGGRARVRCPRRRPRSPRPASPPGRWKARCATSA